MPNRIIKESVCYSETVDQMTWFEECFFHRLWVHCDDYGRMDARLAILKAKLFPLKERMTLKDIENALQKMVDIGCVTTYISDGKPYLYLPSWEVHQSVRAKKSKYPKPEFICKQTQADDCKCPRNPIQSNPNPIICAEQISTPKGTLPLNDGTEYPIYSEQIEKWESLYPNVDIKQELRNMLGWLDANPKKRKTKNGIGRFINGWLAREQDKG